MLNRLHHSRSVVPVVLLTLAASACATRRAGGGGGEAVDASGSMEMRDSNVPQSADTSVLGSIDSNPSLPDVAMRADTPVTQPDTSVVGENRPPEIIFVSIGTALSPSTSSQVRVIVSDPDGLGDIVAGTLTHLASGASLGNFTREGSGGDYFRALTFSTYVGAVPSTSVGTATLRVRFTDSAGHETVRDTDLSVGCGDLGSEICGGTCVDLSTNRTHCGRCNNPAPAGRECEGGTAVCGAGLTMCDTTCANVSTDAANCGACGVSVAPARCVGGCVSPPGRSPAFPTPTSTFCQATTSNAILACDDGDLDCIVTATNSDATPLRAVTGWGSMNCTGCLNAHLVMCAESTCAPTIDALRCCIQRNGCTDGPCIQRLCTAEFESYNSVCVRGCAPTPTEVVFGFATDCFITR